MKTPELKTKRLILRSLNLNDAPWIQTKFNDWEIIKYMNATVPWPYPNDGAETFLKEIALPAMDEGKAFHWAICLKDSPNMGIGVISFRHNTDHHDDHRGFWIERPKQKQGFVTEAVAAVNDFAFDVLGFETFTVENVFGNIGSRKVKQKTGARLVSNHKRHFVCGECDTEVWEVTKEGWTKAKLDLQD